MELTLAQATLRRFKAAFNPDPIPFYPFTLVIGRNGSGKSTVLESLQWLDTALRHNAVVASERYFGATDLVNLRSQAVVPNFEIELAWTSEDHVGQNLRYHVRVAAPEGETPSITEERLWLADNAGHTLHEFISTSDSGERVITAGPVRVLGRDRLALETVASVGTDDEPFEWVRDLTSWWSRAVFLRLSPNRLAEGSPAKRASTDPLLDEEGHLLAALIYELTPDQRGDLAESIQDILEDIRRVEVSTAGSERNQRANYQLFEQMPYRGRSGKSLLPIPAWMLSEGTRRLTAILALLAHDPPPSLLCIEEVENGLDPWTLRAILRHLRDATDAGIQVVATSHSPWLLDDIPLDAVLFVRRTGGDTQYRTFASMDEVEAFDPHIPPGTRYVSLG